MHPSTKEEQRRGDTTPAGRKPYNMFAVAKQIRKSLIYTFGFTTPLKYIYMSWLHAADDYRQRITSMKSTAASNAHHLLDMSAPVSYPHLNQNLKKRLNEEERSQSIVQENLRLMVSF